MTSRATKELMFKGSKPCRHSYNKGIKSQRGYYSEGENIKKDESERSLLKKNTNLIARNKDQ